MNVVKLIGYQFIHLLFTCLRIIKVAKIKYNDC